MPDPEPSTYTSLLVFSGSSGRLLTERAAVLSQIKGLRAEALPWFGAPGLPATPAGVPLEPIAERVRAEHNAGRRVALMGTSYGAELVLLLASRLRGIDLVVAQAPTSMTWSSPDLTGEGLPTNQSKWLWGGQPVPGVPYVAPPAGGFADAREWHEASLAACPDPASYELAVEDIDAYVVIISGGEDRVWQSDWFCEQIVARRERAGRTTAWLHDERAGHQIILPGEAPAPTRAGFPRGGGPRADAALGERLLTHLATRS